MHRLLLVAALALACSRDNPGFGFGTDPGSTTADATTGTTVDASTTTADAGTSTGTTAQGTTTSDDTTGDATTEQPPRVCAPPKSELGLELAAYLDGVPLAPPADCQPRFYIGKGSFSASAIEIAVSGSCDGAEGPTLRVETSFLNDFQWPLPDCFVLALAWNECGPLRSAVVWTLLPIPEFLIAAGVAGSHEPPFGAEYLVGALEQVPDGACECEGEPQECCANGVLEPGAYQVRFADSAGTTLREGQPGVPQADFMGLRFYLETMRSHVHARCDDAPVHVDWFAVQTL
jgi:hypothetical protein